MSGLLNRRQRAAGRACASREADQGAGERGEHRESLLYAKADSNLLYDSRSLHGLMR